MNGNDMGIVKRILSNFKGWPTVFSMSDAGEVYARSHDPCSSNYPWRPVNKEEKEYVSKEDLFEDYR